MTFDRALAWPKVEEYNFPMSDDGTLLIRLAGLDYADEHAESKAPAHLIEEARKAGVRRKIMTRGEGGFHAHFSEFPPGYVTAAHSHDHDEMIIIAEGSMRFDDGPPLGPLDTAVIHAGHTYGFTAGDDGGKFFNIRRGATSIQMSPAGEVGKP